MPAPYGLKDLGMDLRADPDYIKAWWTLKDGSPLLDREILINDSYIAAATAVGQEICPIGVIADKYRNLDIDNFFNAMKTEPIMVVAELRVTIHDFVTQVVRDRVTDMIVKAKEPEPIIYLLDKLYGKLTPGEQGPLESELYKNPIEARRYDEIIVAKEDVIAKEVKIEAIKDVQKAYEDAKPK